jgi:hypothetical protein
MLMTISNDPIYAADILDKAAFCDLPIFSFHMTPDEIGSLSIEEAKVLGISGIIVFGSDYLSLQKLSKLFPGVTAVYIDSGSDDDITSKAIELYRPNTLTADPNIIDVRLSSCCQTLLGYRIELSQAELRILRLLISFSDREFTASKISKICFNDGKCGAYSIPVLVSRINKKASVISGRRLILSKRYAGYRINRFL